MTLPHLRFSRETPDLSRKTIRLEARVPGDAVGQTRIRRNGSVIGGGSLSGGAGPLDDDQSDSVEDLAAAKFDRFHVVDPADPELRIARDSQGELCTYSPLQPHIPRVF